MRNYITPTGAVLTEVEALHLLAPWRQSALREVFKSEAPIRVENLIGMRSYYEKMCDRLVEVGTGDKFPSNHFTLALSPSLDDLLETVRDGDIVDLVGSLLGLELTVDDLLYAWEVAALESQHNAGECLISTRMVELIDQLLHFFLHEEKTNPTLVTPDYTRQIVQMYDQLCGSDPGYQRWTVVAVG